MTSSYQNRLGPKKRERICQIINNDVILREGFMQQGFGARQLCEKYGIRASDISMVMANTYGETFATLLQRLRVSKVCQMFDDRRNDSKSCEAIGLRCGFNSRQSLYNAFKAIKGVTPLEYRNKQRDNNE